MTAIQTRAVQTPAVQTPTPDRHTACGLTLKDRTSSSRRAWTTEPHF